MSKEGASSSGKEGGGMEWLYSSPASLVDREQYLLGKKIDRQVDPLLASEDREKQALASGPGALFTGPSTVGTTTDMAAKVREDPLFLMKKKEGEARRQLLSNPVKMKQLQQLAAREKASKHKPKKKRDRSRSPHRSRRSPKEKQTRDRRQSHSPPPHSSKHHSPHTHKSTLTPPSLKDPTRHTHHSRLSREELERRRKEMMEDAESHGRGREQRLRRLEQGYRKEEEECSNSHSEDFLQPLRKESVAAARSVQERIQRNIGYVQRTRAALDSHFLRK